ncbi:MAG TPA: prolipoprotein diacylglyceryl transferase [Longimicrobiales bacterium]|nr:prolipoprotein diacylglyceryl transferase [Longimicrobiales bacterium]
MFPTLFKIGGFTVTSFGLMMFLAFVAGGWVLSKQLERRGQNPGIAWDVLAWLALGGILGARLYYIALHVDDFVANPMHELLSRGGLVWYGGFIGGVLAYYWQVRKHKLPLATMFDASAPALALAYAVGRVGCFLVGDDYGLPTRSWVGIKFPEGSPPSTAGYLRTVGGQIPANVPDGTVLAVHPTQLYEVGAGLLMFAILWRLSSSRKLRPGRLFAVWLVLYGIERFLIEFVRAKGDRVLLGLSTSQLASALLLVLAAAIWLRARGEPAPAIAGGRAKPHSTTPTGVRA